MSNKGGAPPLYATPEEMFTKIDAYFVECVPEYAKDEKGGTLVLKGRPIVLNLKAPSLSGLALYLGFAARQSIYDNEKRDGFSYIIKRARTKVEEWVYQHTLSGDISPAVGIFILKQFGYTDKQEIEHSVDSEAYSKLKELYG